MNTLCIGDFSQTKPACGLWPAPELCALAKKILDARAEFAKTPALTPADVKALARARADIGRLKRLLVEMDVERLKQNLSLGRSMNPLVQKIVEGARWEIDRLLKLSDTQQLTEAALTFSPSGWLVKAFKFVMRRPKRPTELDVPGSVIIEEMFGYPEIMLRGLVISDRFMLDLDIVKSQIDFARRSIEVERIMAERTEKRLRSADEKYKRALAAVEALYLSWPGAHGAGVYTKTRKTVLAEAECMAKECAKKLSGVPAPKPAPRPAAPPAGEPTYGPPVSPSYFAPPPAYIPPEAPLVYAPISVPSFATPQSLYVVR